MPPEEMACANCGRPLASSDAVCRFCETELAAYHPMFEFAPESAARSAPACSEREDGTANADARPFDIAAYFGADHAAIYDRRIRQRCPSYEALHAMLRHWLAALPDAARILAAGAGTGTEILALGRHHADWRFVAADISADMLTACRARVAAAGLTERVEFHHGPLQSCPAEPLFDAATSVLVSHFIVDRAERLAYYQAIAERLKPRGIFVLADLFGDPDGPGFSSLFEAWLASFADYSASPEEHASDRARILRDISFLPEAELMAMLLEAGFEPPTRFYQTWLFGGWVMTKRGK